MESQELKVALVQTDLIWEAPAQNRTQLTDKINAITAASEAACLILSVDETVKIPKSSGESSNAAKAMNMT